MIKYCPSCNLKLIIHIFENHFTITCKSTTCHSFVYVSLKENKILNFFFDFDQYSLYYDNDVKSVYLIDYKSGDKIILTLKINQIFHLESLKEDSEKIYRRLINLSVFI